MKKKTFLVAVILGSMLLASCGSSSSSKDAYNTSEAPAAMANGAYADYDYGFAEEGYEDVTAESGSSSQVKSEKFNDSARKLIKTYNITIETECFDGLMDAIEMQINNLSGYIQNLDSNNGSMYSSYRYNKTSTMTVRIPKANLEAFVDFVGTSANVTYKNLSVDDVTLSYVDVESRKASYEIEQERLLALLERADNMTDIITIEERLSEVRYLLESMESQLRTYDNLVDYATVHLTINEVETYTVPEPETYGERIARSFTDSVKHVWESFKNFLVSFVGAVPVLVVWAIIISIIVLIVKLVNKSRRKKNVVKENKRAEEMSAIAKENAEKKAAENSKEDNE